MSEATSAVPFIEDAKAPPAPRRGVRAAAPRQVPATFFREVVGSLRNGVIVITSDGRLAHINQEAYRILGLSPAPDDAGRLYTDVLGGVPDIVRILRSAFESTYPPNRAELRLRPTGRVIGYTVCSVRSARGRLTGAALLFKDLTRVEQLEERERLRDRLAVLGEMAAAIAHEVKNPLAGIEVLAGLLKRRLVGVDDAESLLNEIITEAKMANAIVLEILEFVRPVRLQVEPVSVARVIEDAVSMATSLVAPRDTRIVARLPDTLPALEADAHQLRQLFTNLVANALEALEGCGTITISASTRPGEGDPDSIDVPFVSPAVILEVADDGPGVPEEVRDRIFSPFFTTKARGSGLGLAIVRKIVDAHDGRIDLKAGRHGGTCFRVTLPVVAAREAANPFASQAGAVQG